MRPTDPRSRGRDRSSSPPSSSSSYSHNSRFAAIINIIIIFVTSFVFFVSFNIAKCDAASVDVNAATVLSPPNRHLSYNETVQYLEALRRRYPRAVHLQSIGKSVQKRDLWIARISGGGGGGDDYEDPKKTESIDFVDSIRYYTSTRRLLKPTVRLIGTIHGDEPLGAHLLLSLAHYLVTSRSPRIVRLLNRTDIELLPLMNPDGFAIAREGDCTGVRSAASIRNGRENANSIDLDRNFALDFEQRKYQKSKIAQIEKKADPMAMMTDITGAAISPQPETVAVMTWSASNPSNILSAAIHTGRMVVAYPLHSRPDPAADQRLFRQIASDYVGTHRDSARFTAGCREAPNEAFAAGITSGFAMAPAENTMADYNYLNTNCIELDLYLSCCKYGNSSTLRAEWNANRESLLRFISSAHLGVKGIVSDARTRAPIAGAIVSVEGNSHRVTSSDRGEYWRLLPPAQDYRITATAFGYTPVTISVKIDSNTKSSLLPGGEEAKIVNFDLVPSSSSSSGNNNQDEEKMADFPEFHASPEFAHHNYAQMTQQLKALAAKFPAITRLYSAGKTVEKREIWVLEITDNPGVHECGEPEFKFVANMHGNEVIGREMVLLFAKLLLENYGQHHGITSTVNETRIHLMPSMNPDGWERSRVGDCDSSIGRGNANGVDLNRNFPDQYKTYEENRNSEPETVAIMRWLSEYPFVLSANLHGGSLVANYPFDGNNRGDDTAGYMRTPDDALFRHLTSVYSKAHPYMHLGECHEKCSDAISLLNEHFDGGITNGAQWYPLYGGMQDWNYLHTNCYEVTIEMGCRKYPPARDLPRYWRENRRPMLLLLNEVHRGVKGVIRDSATNSSLSGVEIRISGIDHVIRSVPPYGDYWRLLQPGEYELIFSMPGYADERRKVTIKNDTTPSAQWIEIRLHSYIGGSGRSKNGGNDRNSFLAAICLVVILAAMSCIVIACCPGVPQEISYICGACRKNLKKSGKHRGGKDKSNRSISCSRLFRSIIICFSFGRRNRKSTKIITGDKDNNGLIDNSTFQYTKLSSHEINLGSESDDDEEDMTFDVNHLMKK